MNATAVKKTAAKTASKTASKKAIATKVARKVAAKKAAPQVKDTVANKTPVLLPTSAAVLPAPAKIEKIKIKLVRDSFTMPADDWALIAQLKERALAFKRPAKKSELLRAGLQALAALPDAKLKSSLDKLQPLKPGRPKNDKK